MSTPKEFIIEYLRTLSGQPKPPELVRKYVADPVLLQHIASVEAAFPNYEIRVEDAVAEGDKVVIRGQFAGVQRGAFAGVEPSGNAVSAGLIVIYRVDNNRIVEHWMQFDRFELVRQLQSATVP